MTTEEMLQGTEKENRFRGTAKRGIFFICEVLYLYEHKAPGAIVLDSFARLKMYITTLEEMILSEDITSEA